MRTTRLSALASAALAAGFLLPAPGWAQTSSKPDPEALARKLVTEVADIAVGDVVRISGSVRDADLLEALAVAVRQVGAFPLITLGSDGLSRRMYEDVPDHFDAQPPKFELALAGLVTAEFNVDVTENPGTALAGVPEARITTVDSARTAVSILKNSRGVQEINLGNEIYPTEALARRFGVPRSELERMFWAAVNVDYDLLQERGAQLKQIFEDGSEVRITHPNGTDLRMQIGGSLPFVSDGVISQEERLIGGASRLTWLPAGEVYLVPESGTANGTVVVDRQYYEGGFIEGLRLTIENGRLTAMSASSGIQRLRARYDAAGAGKEQFGLVDVGINPEIRNPPGGNVVAWMMEGMVTIGLGANAWAGGSNNVTFSLNSHLPGVTMTVDGMTIVDAGTLVAPLPTSDP